MNRMYRESYSLFEYGQIDSAVLTNSKLNVKATESEWILGSNLMVLLSKQISFGISGFRFSSWYFVLRTLILSRLLVDIYMAIVVQYC